MQFNNPTSPSKHENEQYDNFLLKKTKRSVASTHHVIPWNRTCATRICEEIRSAAASHRAGSPSSQRSGAKHLSHTPSPPLRDSRPAAPMGLAAPPALIIPPAWPSIVQAIPMWPTPLTAP